MLKETLHIGLTVDNIEDSIEFYKNILGFNFVGKITMKGKETDNLFNLSNSYVEVAYFKVSNNESLPLIELIEFKNNKIKKHKKSLINNISISEICFSVDNIDEFYEHLINNNVECISKPQTFDFSENGFSKTKAFYFRDINGIILEVMQEIN